MSAEGNINTQPIEITINKLFSALCISQQEEKPTFYPLDISC